MEKYKKKLWCYSNPGVMKEHRYSDDVALCMAFNKTEAMAIFQQIYSNELLKENVSEVKFNDYGIFIATDY